MVTVTAQMRLHIEDFQLETGQTATVSLLLENSAPVTALQADLAIPEGLTIVGDGGGAMAFTLTDRKAPDHSLSSTTLSNGDVRIIVGSPSNAELDDTDGAVVTFGLTAADGMAAGDYTITVSNAKAFAATGERFDIESSTAIVSIVEPVPEPPLRLARRMARLPLGQKLQIELAEPLDVEWSSEDETIATVDAGGEVTALAPGMVAINVTSAGGQTAWFALFSYLPGDENDDTVVDVGDVNKVLEIILNDQ